MTDKVVNKDNRIYGTGKNTAGIMKFAVATVTVFLLSVILNVKTTFAAEITITTAEQLQSIGKDASYPLDGDYVLGANIDFGGNEFAPVGTFENPFTGTFDGKGYTLSGMNIVKTEPGTDSMGHSVTGYGIFGVAGSENKDDATVIKNLILSNISVSGTDKGNVAAAILCAVVRDAVKIENVAVISSDITIDGGKKGTLLGAGAIAGMAVQGNLKANQYIEITDIYSNCDITVKDFVGEVTASGIVGCVYEKYIGYIGKIVSLGDVIYNDETGYGIITSKKYDGNGIVRKYERCYYIRNERKNSGVGYGIAKGVLADTNVALSDMWYKETGAYPILSVAKDKDVINRLVPIMSREQLYSCITADFVLPVTYNGKPVSWTSSSDIVVIDGSGKVTIDFSRANASEVVLEALYQGEKKALAVVIGEKKEIKFSKDYVILGDTLKVLNAPEGSTFKWVRNDRTTGTKTTLENTTDSYVITEDDFEGFITVTVNGSTKISIYVSKLPVVYLEGDVGYSDIKKTSYYDGNIKFCGDGNEYNLKDFYEGALQFKGRGHSSSYYGKMPLRLKFETKADVYGISGYESRHWVLLGNVLDHTFMRNTIVNHYALGLGAEPVMQMKDVVLVYNGEYQGIYQLSEKIRIEEGRTDIFDYDEYGEKIAETIAKALVEDGKLAAHYEEQFEKELAEYFETDYTYVDAQSVTYEGITYKFGDYGITGTGGDGGYQVVMDFYSRQLKNKLVTMYTAYTLPTYIDSPDTDLKTTLKSFKDSNLYKYAVALNQSFEYALHSDDFFFRNEDTHYVVVDDGSYYNGKWRDTVFKETEYTDDINNGKHYSQMFDMDSLVQNFLICEFTLNFDSMKNSFYYYKDEGGLAKIGPFWDYDWSMGNHTVSSLTRKYTKWQTTTDAFTYEQYYQYVSWNRMLIRDPYFLVKAYEKYHRTRHVLEEIVCEGGLVDQRYRLLKNEAVANDRRFRNSVVYDDFESAMEDIRSYLKNRLEWLDKQFADFDTFVQSLGYYRTSEYLEVESLVKNEDGTISITASANNDDIAYIAFQVNGTYLVQEEVVDGKAVVTVPASVVSGGEINIVEIKAKDSSDSYMVYSKYSDPGNYNLIHSNYFEFDY